VNQRFDAFIRIQRFEAGIIDFAEIDAFLEHRQLAAFPAGVGL